MIPKFPISAKYWSFLATLEYGFCSVVGRLIKYKYLSHHTPIELKIYGQAH